MSMTTSMTMRLSTPPRPRSPFRSCATALAALALCAPLMGLAATAPAQPPKPAKPSRSSADILATAPASVWRDVDPDNLLVMTLPQGQVFIELAPRFAPAHVDNIRALARGGYYDGLAIVRVQDNFVTQWGDPNADDEDTGMKGKGKPFPAGAKAHLPAEFSIPLKGVPMTVLPDVDGWAPRVGQVDGFAAAADPKAGKAWLAHCYGSVGAGRGNAADSSTGAELYAVIGQAPRGLDLNITVVGRVLKGMEFLSSLPRGGAAMGFYDKPEQRLGIERVALAAALPAEQRPALQVLRTDTPTWQELLDARRHRGGWFVHSPGYTDLCSAAVPVRVKPAAGPEVKLNEPKSPESRR
ncbi:peptidylprolyl isomerase [Mitsuaria sp. BK037]|uniref:peptidylprolyl isomerase n=1 Tax=Mitsuaria sp. BK037 TaxID=2587122 RepID=UPI001820C4A5|nr:peptidylprolyl isomerase [Mitsuaria sp. BK037]MBB3281943.1 peptidylprolyl isomerase [Mitsuaria sp. BK037]